MLFVGRIARSRGDSGGTAATALMVPLGDEAHRPGARRRRLISIRRGGAPPPARAAGPAGSFGGHHPPPSAVQPRVDPSAFLPAAALPSPALPVPVSPAGSTGSRPAVPLSIPLLPGERTTARRLRFALVNACTVASLLLGLSAIFLAIEAVDIRWAAMCLIACVAFDGLDGALARRLGVASPFGAQMDSLADMSSFGIAAPVVVYAWLDGSAPAALVAPACALVAVGAAIRLARFNVSPKDGRYFCGVPTTMAAAVLALGTLVGTDIPSWLRIGGVAVLALAMVTSFPYAKLTRLLRLPPWLLVLPVIGALLDYQITFGVVVVAYLLSGPLLWARNRRVTA